MNFLNFRFVSVVIQSSVLFVGFSTLLGRVYFLSYFDSLGIPYSALKLATIDYAIVSPAVTITGIMLSISPVIFFVFTRLLSELKIFSEDSLWGLAQIPVGLAVAGASLLAATIIPVETDAICGCSIWSWSIVKFLSPALLSMAGAILLNGLVHLSSLIAKYDTTESQKLNSLGRLFAGTLLALVLLLSLHLSASYSSAIGETDAEATLKGSPQVVVELKTTRADEALNNVDGCLETYDRCIFRIVLIGESLVYLLPTIIEPSHFGTSIYSMPIEDIRQITYLPK